MSPRHRQTERARGFTLVELLVVIGIMALVASMATVAIAPMLEGRSLRAGARMVQSIVFRARAYAVNQRTPATIVLEADGDFMEIYPTPTLASGASPADRVDEPTFLPRGIEFVTPLPQTDGPGATFSGETWIVFSRTGGLDEDEMGTGNVEITLEGSGGEETKIIEVLFTSGQTRTRDG